MLKRAAVCAVLGVLVAARGLVAQEDAWVLPFGTVRVGASGSYSQWDDRFGSAGWEGLLGPLDDTGFAPLVELRSGLDALLSATGGAPLEPGALTLGEPEVDLRADVREVPMEVSIGVLPRVQLGLTLPIQRSELTVARLSLSDGLVGANPDPDANAAAFAAAGPEFEALGRSAFLPLASSPVGEELIRRLASVGSTPTLPVAAAGDSLLNAALVDVFGVEPLRGGLSPWRLGDARLDGRLLLVTTMGDDVLATGRPGLEFRATAFGGLRLPTGTRSDTVRLYDPEPAVGLSGWNAGLAADLFIGSVIGLSASASHTALQSVDVVRRVADPAAPLATAEPPRALRWTPPTETRLRVSPRAVLEEAISIGLEYELVRIGGSTLGDEGGVLVDLAEGTLQRIGGSIRFSSVQRWIDGGDVLPFEAALAYVTDLSGPANHPDGATLTVTGRLFHRLWGN